MKGPDNLLLPPSIPFPPPFPLTSPPLSQPPHPIPCTLCPGAPFCKYLLNILVGGAAAAAAAAVVVGHVVCLQRGDTTHRKAA